MSGVDWGAMVAGLLGAVVGGGATGGATWATLRSERRRAEENRQYEWDADRLRRILVAADAAADAADRLQATYMRPVAGRDREAAIWEFGSAAKLFESRLLGSDKYEAAHSVIGRHCELVDAEVARQHDSELGSEELLDAINRFEVFCRYFAEYPGNAAAGAAEVRMYYDTT